MGSHYVDGGVGPQMIVAVITVLVLIVSLVIGFYMLFNNDAGLGEFLKDAFWGPAFLGIGLIGLFSFGSGFVAGKSAGVAGGVRTAFGVAKYVQ